MAFFTQRVFATTALALVLLTTASCATSAGAIDPRFEDGTLPEGATLDDAYPGITRLDQDLVSAVRAAEADAADEGIEFVVTGGWRAKDLQRRLYDDAIEEYGSAEAASRWVATPEGSAHTAGQGIDIGPMDAASWLNDNGARYDLCRIFDNEAWHFELREGARAHGCPRLYWDASFDPRNDR